MTCRGSCVVALAVLLIVGCGTGKEDVSKERLEKMAGGALKEVVPISGKVLVDGEPKGGVNLYLHPSTGGESISNCRTKVDGTFCWSTYMACDGLEPGNYRISFRYVPKQKANDRSEASDDLFKGRYSNPMKVEHPLTVAKGSPQTDVKYELNLK